MPATQAGPQREAQGELALARGARAHASLRNRPANATHPAARAQPVKEGAEPLGRRDGDVALEHAILGVRVHGVEPRSSQSSIASSKKSASCGAICTTTSSGTSRPRRPPRARPPPPAAALPRGEPARRCADVGRTDWSARQARTPPHPQMREACVAAQRVRRNLAAPLSGTVTFTRSPRSRARRRPQERRAASAVVCERKTSMLRRYPHWWPVAARISNSRAPG